MRALRRLLVPFVFRKNRMQLIRSKSVPENIRPAPRAGLKAFAAKWRRRVARPRPDSRAVPAPTRHGRDLALLLEASATLASSRNLDELLDALCREMAELVESTYCRIYLLDGADSQLSIRAFYAKRPLEWEPGIGRTVHKELLPWHTQAVVNGKHFVVSTDFPDTPIQEPEYSMIFRPGIHSVLLMPLMSNGRCLGVASLGEMRAWKRTPFAPEKIELCRTVARQGALAIDNFRTLNSLAHQNREIKLILDNVADGVFRTDTEGRILAFNPAAERMTGYSAGDIVGRPCAGTFRGQDGDGCALCGTRCPVQQLLRSGDAAQPAEIRESITRFDGTRVPIMHSVAPVLDQHNNLIGTVSVIRDVSREEEMVRIRSEFISLVSHQLRAPLANMSAAAGLLVDSEMDEASRKEMLRAIDEQCQRLSQLVNEVLESARLEKGRLAMTLEPLDLAPLLLQAVEAHRSRFKSYNIQIDAAATLPIVLGNRDSVGVVIDNLLQNALNYSPSGTALVLSVEDAGDAVTVSVTDQGVGIPPDQLDNIFLPFHRGAHAANRAVSGFGLGLHIARMLVEAQGGKIWAENRPVRGACFRFTLQKLRE